MTTDRQIKAVVAAIAKERWTAAADMLKGKTNATTEVLNERYAKAAIEASDAKYVPALVGFIKDVRNIPTTCAETKTALHKMCGFILAQLPPELRGE